MYVTDMLRRKDGEVQHLQGILLLGLYGKPVMER